MDKSRRTLLGRMAVPLGWLLAPALHAQSSPDRIGVVLMHGKGGSPRGAISDLASVLQAQGFQVASLEMPWSRRRAYDADMAAGVQQVTRALDALRGRGARKLFVAGHSQGGLFAVHYGGQHRVDGIVAIAPAGQVDMADFFGSLGEHVAVARRMVAEGRGAETALFGDYEGSRGAMRIRTTAQAWLSWFDPAGDHTSRAFGRVLPGTPVLYVAPTRDHPALARVRNASFAALPRHPRSHLLEVEADHTGAPGAAAGSIVDWIRAVSGP